MLNLWRPHESFYQSILDIGEASHILPAQFSCLVQRYVSNGCWREPLHGLSKVFLGQDHLWLGPVCWLLRFPLCNHYYYQYYIITLSTPPPFSLCSWETEWKIHCLFTCSFPSLCLFNYTNLKNTSQFHQQKKYFRLKNVQFVFKIIFIFKWYGCKGFC